MKSFFFIKIFFGRNRFNSPCRLAVSASWDDPFLKDLEKKVKALHRHLSAHPMATVDLIFWADLAQEDILRGAANQPGQVAQYFEAYGIDPPELHLHFGTPILPMDTPL